VKLTLLNIYRGSDQVFVLYLFYYTFQACGTKSWWRSWVRGEWRRQRSQPSEFTGIWGSRIISSSSQWSWCRWSERCPIGTCASILRYNHGFGSHKVSI